MSGMKQVKVDNWGIFFLQRLKHFFNRTDYCDLTLQFQDNAQLKVHRLVLNACTEYFELLERTCEMYEDCLIMPDDLQADVVVPIVNFMYTGQLEYKFNLFDRLYATAQIMNMSVLTKLLDAQRVSQVSPAPKVSPQIEFQSNRTVKKPYTQKKVYIPSRKYGRLTNDISIAKTPQPSFIAPSKKRPTLVDSARPTRYELPEELDHDEIFESSFSDISYESRPLMVHPKLIKEECKEEYQVVYSEASSSRKFEDLKRTMKRPSTSSSDIEPKRLNIGQNKELMFEDRSRDDYLIDDDVSNVDIFDTMSNQCVVEDSRIMQVREDSNSLFDQAAGESSSAKVTLDTRSLKQGGENVDHAKIISEVLKKYPHLVKSNKNIKLRIMTSPNKSESKSFAKKSIQLSQQREQRQVKNVKQVEESKADWTISDIMDTKEVGRLISLGVENVNGPWLCLICGTPGKALNFISYHRYRRHLTEVHKEKVAPNICEYCGLKSGKRNHLLHHIYTKHGVPPPPSYHFPKCNQCNYIALTEAFLIKHKLSHLEVREFTCNVCAASFKTTPQLLQHIQSTGHKISPDRKSTNQCMYCQKLFLREANLYAHLKIVHKTLARSDGIIDNSDEEQETETGKYEVSNYNISEESHEVSNTTAQYQIQQQLDGKIQILTKRTKQKQQHKILNKSLDQPSSSRRIESPKTLNKIHHNVNQDLLHGLDQNVADTEAIISADGSIVDRIVVLNQNEYILKPADTQLERSEADAQLERNMRTTPMDTDEYILSDVLDTEYQNLSSTINISLPQQNNTMQLVHPKVGKNQAHIIIPQPKQGNKKGTTISQPIQIVVSNEQDYKNLVSSASSIIFDDGTQSKSLSVMSRGTPVGTNINLESVDGNDMMILQEEFNVSEAVSTDNSNIVVVYSHPVEDQNKEYSIDTTYTEAQVENQQEDIESQVVDNSLIESEDQQVKLVEEDINSQVLTEENLVHETVENWQEHTIDQTTNISELPLSSQVVEILDTTLTPIEEPEQMETESPEGILEESQSQDTVIEEHEEVFTSEEPNVTTLIVSEPEIEHNFVNDENIVVSEEQVPDDTSVQVDSAIDEVEVVQEEGENHVHETEIEQSVVITEPEVQEKILEQNIEVTSTEPIIEEADADADSPVNEEKEQTTDVQETVATLTSEWSDEEVSNKETSPIEEPCSEVPVEHQIEEAAEIEESIENIQEEVQKQLNEVTVPILLSNKISNNVIIETRSEADDNNEVTENNEKPSEASLDDSIATETEEEDDVATPKSNDKISSLLNEWEDNDSQNETTETIEEPVVDKSKDKIKSLVSDWDEDEEIKK